MRHNCLVPLDVIDLIIFRKEYMLRNSKARKSLKMFVAIASYRR
jgi:hypothetical protein